MTAVQGTDFVELVKLIPTRVIVTILIRKKDACVLKVN